MCDCGALWSGRGRQVRVLRGHPGERPGRVPGELQGSPCEHRPSLRSITFLIFCHLDAACVMASRQIWPLFCLLVRLCSSAGL